MGKKRNSEFKEIAEPRFKFMFTILMDGLFLILWIALQFGVSSVIKTLPLENIDYWTFLVFQVFFAVSTFLPIAINTWKDLRVMFIRAKRSISNAKGELPTLDLNQEYKSEDTYEGDDIDDKEKTKEY